MATSTLTGSRIRQMRLEKDLRQSDLAAACGISPSYLNLIEHNRRRVGEDLMGRIAAALEVPVDALSRGADFALIDALRDAASARGMDARRAEDFAARFPGWAALVSEQAARIARLERSLEALNDRLTHDPLLSASLHELLSTVTSLRSTAGILTGDEAVDPEWQARFLTNIHEDAQRLADSSRSLVAYLDVSEAGDGDLALPQAEVDRWLERLNWHVSALEGPATGPDSAGSVLAEAEELTSPAAREIAARFLDRYRADARIMPLGAFREAVGRMGLRPDALAQAFGADLAAVLRRLATLPVGDGLPPMGLMACDASGVLTARKPIDGFPLPRYGAACPLLPLYQAMTRPMTPLKVLTVHTARPEARHLAYAIAQPVGPQAFDAPQTFEATMLVLPAPEAGGGEVPVSVGTACRVCPREACPARREASILGGNASAEPGEVRAF